MAKILIVEDEPNMVSGLRDNFQFEGYEVLTAVDGVAGLQTALNESPDIVARRHDAADERAGSLQATEVEEAFDSSDYADSPRPGSGQSRGVGVGRG